VETDHEKKIDAKEKLHIDYSINCRERKNMFEEIKKNNAH
jgi:hypothetical protein